MFKLDGETQEFLLENKATRPDFSLMSLQFSCVLYIEDNILLPFWVDFTIFWTSVFARRNFVFVFCFVFLQNVIPIVLLHNCFYPMPVMLDWDRGVDGLGMYDLSLHLPI